MNLFALILYTSGPLLTSTKSLSLFDVFCDFGSENRWFLATVAKIDNIGAKYVKKNPRNSLWLNYSPIPGVQGVITMDSMTTLFWLTLRLNWTLSAELNILNQVFRFQYWAIGSEVCLAIAELLVFLSILHCLWK